MRGVPGSSEPINLLLIEPDVSIARRYVTQLERCDIAIARIGSEQLAQTALAEQARAGWDVVILSVDGFDDASASHIRAFKELNPDSAIIALSAGGSLTQAVEMMRLGADDFLIKPASAEQLVAAVRRVQARLPRSASHAMPGRPDAATHKLIGSSATMRSMFQTIERAAASKATVFLKGESGTGKELCAEAVHAISPRAHGPLISINCSAIPRELMESEIFGHERGAFTGATDKRSGAAELADGGTLFLDEICEMDLALQAKLLRFIQTGQFSRVGGSKVKNVDVRFVCATNKDPMDAVNSGAFRSDLFYRLHVLPVVLPPLRERGADIMEIARHALAQFSAEEGKTFQAIDPAVEELLMHYWWPGNVRELLNVIRNVVVMNDGHVVTSDMLPLALAYAAGGDRPSGTGSTIVDLVGRPDAAQTDAQNTELLKPLWQHEQDIIERAIAACDGNIGMAAAHLGINPSTIYRKRQNWAQQSVA